MAVGYDIDISQKCFLRFLEIKKNWLVIFETINCRHDIILNSLHTEVMKVEVNFRNIKRTRPETASFCGQS